MKKLLLLLLIAAFIFPIKSTATLWSLCMPLVAMAPPLVVCDSYNYSDWSECSASGEKTRQIEGGYPEGCSQCAENSPTPIISVSCIPSCAERVYSSWGECVTGQQTRTITEYNPLGCEGQPPDSPVLTQSCISCTGRIYSNWSDCIDGTQERVMLYKTPSGCVDEPEQDPVLYQSCNEEETIIEKDVDVTENATIRLMALENVEGAAIYYLASNNKKYVFPDSKTYFTWYKNYDDVERVSIEELDLYDDGGMMPYRAGVKLITHQNTARVYAVEPSAILRVIPSEEIAKNLYGENWASIVQDIIPGAFSAGYTIGEPLSDKLPTGTLIQKDENVYYINYGKKRIFADIDSIEVNRYDLNNTIHIDNVSNYNDGESIVGYEKLISELVIY